VEHPKFGRQFSVESFSAALPADVNGIRKYLSSGLIRGIGKVYTDKIVDYFGADTFDIISTESARLLEVPGIGKARPKYQSGLGGTICAARCFDFFTNL
jgi:exodeoxyribonuclease V alpha subunit